MIKNLVKFRFFVIVVFFILSVISCEENNNSNPFIGTWNGLDNNGEQIELIITETTWVLLYIDNNISLNGTYNYNGNTGTFLEPVSGMGGVGSVSGNILTATISEFTFILTNDGTPVGTFQFRITGVPNHIIEYLKGVYWFGARMFTNYGKEALVAYTFKYEIGGTENNYWIQFYLYNVTEHANGNITVYNEKYIGLSGYYDLHFWVLGPNSDWITYSMIWYQRFDVNTMNSIPYIIFTHT